MRLHYSTLEQETFRYGRVLADTNANNPHLLNCCAIRWPSWPWFLNVCVLYRWFTIWITCIRWRVLIFSWFVTLPLFIGLRSSVLWRRALWWNGPGSDILIASSHFPPIWFPWKRVVVQHFLEQRVDKLMNLTSIFLDWSWHTSLLVIMMAPWFSAYIVEGLFSFEKDMSFLPLNFSSNQFPDCDGNGHVFCFYFTLGCDGLSPDSPWNSVRCIDEWISTDKLPPLCFFCKVWIRIS